MTAVVAPSIKHQASTTGCRLDSSLADGMPRGALPRDFEVLVREYAGRLLAVARRFLRSEEDATDAVQEAFLSALLARESFRGTSTPFTWLYRIVVNVCLMRIRSQPRVKVVSLDNLLPTFGGSECPRHPVAPRSQSAEDRLERDELCATVRNCIDQLPDDYRTILLLRDIEELDTEQTAGLLHLSRAAVKTRLHRARQSLRTLLGPVAS